MGHLGHLREEYSELVERLEGGQVSFPYPNDPAAQEAFCEILEILFTPREARLATLMPVKPSRIETVAKRLGMSAEEAEPLLGAMADKGIVMDVIHPKTGEVRWTLAPPVVGFVEFSLMRAEGQDEIPKRRLAQALDTYMHGDDTFAREVFGGDTLIGRSLVHENALGEDQLPDVLDWERATSLISRSELVAVSYCYCRHKAEHLGTRCDAPIENCLTINLGADHVIRRKFGRKIETAQALDILTEAREHGLVHIADNCQNYPTYICNCCGCCCAQLRSINELDLRGVNPSGFEAVSDPELCRGCSKCAKACPIRAINMVAKPTLKGKKSKGRNRLVAQVDLDRCIGCGVCIDSCRHEAITMKRRPKRPYVPSSLMERTLRMAMERGHLAHYIFDQGTTRGSRFLNQALQSILELPPAQRALANEQLRSRFIRFAIGSIKKPSHKI